MSNLAAPVFKQQLWLALGGTVCALAYLYLTLAATGDGTASLTQMLTTCGIAFFLTIGLWGYYDGVRAQLSLPLVLFFAILFRAIGAAAYPVLEDDFYRYLWDGRSVIELGTPYASAPADFFADTQLSDRFVDVLSAISHPEIATVYGPTAQWLFAIAYLLAPGSSGFLQIVFAGADVVVVVVLLRLAPARSCFLYAFSPLLIKEFAMSAHVDVVGILFMVLALHESIRARWWSVGILLALAAGVKLFALVVAPFLLLWHVRGWLTFIATALLSALPFGVLNAWAPAGLKAMGSDWVFNAPVYLLARSWLDAFEIAALKLSLLGMFAAVWLFVLWRWSQRCWYRSSLPLSELPLFWLFGVFFAVLPVQNPWYLIWWLPFAVLRPIVTPWVASAAMLLSYVSGINLAGHQTGIELGLYEQPTWVLVVEFSCMAIAALYDFRRLNFPAGRA